MPDTSPVPSDYVPPDQHTPLAPGAEPVPGYKLVKKLGQGGFGEVWRATAPGGFPVAMKFVTLTEKAGATELRSLEVLRELRHPNLLPVSGAWQSEWRLTVAMELADGTLLDRLKEAQAAGQAGIPGPELLAHLRGAAAGLDYLHAKKLQHRDVKPQNLLLVGGAVKVADFGMVRALKESSSKHTSGMSVDYAPPEFFKERVSRHSDQYSLAVAYCELRGGRRPFTGNLYELMAKHTHDEPDLSMLPDAEQPVVARALAKEPGERWASCGEFAEAVGRAMADPPPVARRASTTTKRLPPRASTVPKPPPRRRGPAVALLGLAVVAAGAGVAFWPKGERPPTTGRESPPVASAKSDPLPGPDKTKPEPTGKSPPTVAKIGTDTKPKPEPPEPPADDGKAFVSRTTGMKFVRIPAGTFRMGSPESDKEADTDEKPQHEVTLTKDFYMGVHEVTRGQFRKFVEDSGYKTEAEEGDGAYGWDAAKKSFEMRKEFNWKNAGFEQTDDHPVVNVSWTDATKFAEWLSKKDGQVYRLPTEAEWEYSCRGGASFKYHFGDDPEEIARYGNVADGTATKQFPDWTAIKAEDGYVYTAPVGRFRPNAFGLYDMHGNVWEWCADWFGDYPAKAVTNPLGPDRGSDRVRRGGSWSSSARDGRAACRGGCNPSFRFNILGFRVAAVPAGQ